jgi:hypothetical protein
LILSFVSCVRLLNAIGLERLAFNPEFVSFVRDGQIAFPLAVVIVSLEDVRKNGVGKVHLPEFVFRDIAKHEPSHARILADDLSKFILG